MIVSISGLSGSGKSTLAKQLSTLMNWPHISGGKYFRDMATERGCSIYELSTLALEDSKIDKIITQRVFQEMKKQENCILDAHGAALIAKGLKQFCILLHCPIAIRIKRVSHRTGENYIIVKRSIERLDEETIQRFETVYGKSILDLDLYDIVVNTHKYNIDRIVSFLKKQIE